MKEYKEKIGHKEKIGQRGRGLFFEAMVTEQANTKDLIYKGRARANDRIEVSRLLKTLYFKGVDIPKRFLEREDKPPPNKPVFLEKSRLMK